MNYEEKSEIIKSISHPVRLQIIDALLNGSKCNVNEVAEKLNLHQSTLSQHLSILKSRGIIRPKKDGVRTCYEIVDDRIIKIFNILNDDK